MYGIIYTVHAPLCSIHFLISLIDKKSPFPMLYNPTFLYTFVFSISWLLNPAMYAYKYRLAFLSETNRWLSINYQTKKVCLKDSLLLLFSYLTSSEVCNIWNSLSSFGAMIISVRRFLLLPSAVSLSSTGIYSPRPLGCICKGFTP